MQCCGQERTTKYCPDCGKAMVSPLASLLKHVNTQVRGAVNSIASAQDGIGRNDSNQIAYRIRERIAEAKLAKWQAWADELKKAIARIKELDDGK